MMFLGILLVISVVLNGVCIYGILRALKNTEAHEAFFDEMQNRLRKTVETMNAIDLRGSFQSDDEVGGVFEQMHAMINALDVFLLGESDDAQES